MDVKKLYASILESYSDKNLNLITGRLIFLYKKGEFNAIREAAEMVSQYVPIETEKAAKCFSNLIMLYHPDKGEYNRKAIENLYGQKDFEGLNKFSHIFLMDNLDDITASVIDEDVDYQPEYSWDSNTREGYGYTDGDGESEPEQEFVVDDYERSFYNMIKIMEYGNVDVEFPSYYLEDFEEFEMANRGLESLDGVEYCIHVKILDVSNNNLTDIENLWGLKNLEELYLANNQIGFIDVLSNLNNLKIIDISGNQIDDITPILELPQLEYVNLIGNPVPEEQIKVLEENGVIVMHK